MLKRILNLFNRRKKPMIKFNLAVDLTKPSITKAIEALDALLSVVDNEPTTKDTPGVRGESFIAPGLNLIDTGAQPPQSGTPLEHVVAPQTDTSETAPKFANMVLDNDGIPWDGRIHTSTKKKLKREQTWKLIPGIDKTFARDIITGLQLEYAEEVQRRVDAEAGASNVPDKPTAPPAPPAAPDAGATPPAPPEESEGLTAAQVIQKTTQRIADKLLTFEGVQETLKTFNLADITGVLTVAPEVLIIIDNALYNKMLAEGTE